MPRNRTHVLRAGMEAAAQLERSTRARLVLRTVHAHHHEGQGVGDPRRAIPGAAHDRAGDARERARLVGQHRRLRVAGLGGEAELAGLGEPFRQLAARTQDGRTDELEPVRRKPRKGAGIASVERLQDDRDLVGARVHLCVRAAERPQVAALRLRDLHDPQRFDEVVERPLVDPAGGLDRRLQALLAHLALESARDERPGLARRRRILLRDRFLRDRVLRDRVLGLGRARRPERDQGQSGNVSESRADMRHESSLCRARSSERCRCSRFSRRRERKSIRPAGSAHARRPARRNGG